MPYPTKLQVHSNCYLLNRRLFKYSLCMWNNTMVTLHDAINSSLNEVSLYTLSLPPYIFPGVAPANQFCQLCACFSYGFSYTRITVQLLCGRYDFFETMGAEDIFLRIQILLSENFSCNNIKWYFEYFNWDAITQWRSMLQSEI